jgi:hypothetical protein
VTLVDPEAARRTYDLREALLLGRLPVFVRGIIVDEDGLRRLDDSRVFAATCVLERWVRANGWKCITGRRLSSHCARRAGLVCRRQRRRLRAGRVPRGPLSTTQLTSGTGVTRQAVTRPLGVFRPARCPVSALP